MTPVKCDLLLHPRGLYAATYAGLEICGDLAEQNAAVVDGRVDPQILAEALEYLAKTQFDLDLRVAYDVDDISSVYEILMQDVRHCWRITLTDETPLDQGPTTEIATGEPARLISYGYAGDWLIVSEDRPGAVPVTVWVEDWTPGLESEA